jgi:IS30 family transposase
MAAEGSTEFKLEERNIIQKMLENGDSHQKIADVLGRSRSGTKAEINRYGGRNYYNAEVAHKLAMERKAKRHSYLRRNFSSEQIDMIRNFYLQGYSQGKIAVLMNCHKEVLHRVVAENNIDINARSENILTNSDRITSLEQQLEIILDLIMELKNAKNK